MIPRKLIENAFTRWWMLLIPVVLAPALVLVLTPTADQFESTASVWVARPGNIDPGALTRSANPYQSVADSQVQVFSDLLNTQAFRGTVAAAAGLRGSDGQKIVGRSIRVVSVGPNLIEIRATSSSADLAQKLGTALIAQYQARSEAESQRETSIAVEYFTNQMTLAQTELDHRRVTAAAYLQAHPSAADPRTVDPEYQRLLGATDSQAKVVDGLLSSLQNAQRAAASAPQGLQAAFSVQDSPNQPLAPLHVSIAKRLGYPLVAFVVGVLLSAGIVYVRFRTDHSIRSQEDLRGLSVPLLAVVPDLRPTNHVRLAAAFTLGWTSRRWRVGDARSVAASIGRATAGKGAAR